MSRNLVVALLSLGAVNGCGPDVFEGESNGVPAGKSSYLEEFRINSRVSEIDWLFVVDDSPHMADKAPVLRESIARMVADLVFPPCSSGWDEPLVPQSDSGCPEGTTPRGPAPRSVHVGFISSSLGGHGSSACPDTAQGRHNNDRGQLLPAARGRADDLPLFVSWERSEPWQSFESPSRSELMRQVHAQLELLNSDGCEYPAPLEAMYRFLIEPQPSLQLIKGANGEVGAAYNAQGELLIDEALLEQRRAFLRAESELNIVIITDQDDCSVIRGDSEMSGAATAYRMLDPQSDAEPGSDRPGLRCYDSAGRFGTSLLYPKQRYVDGLLRSKLTRSDGSEVSNPLFISDAGKVRYPELVSLTLVAGIPWQDIATPDSLGDPGRLQYLSASGLELTALAMSGSLLEAQASYWDLLLGDDESGVAPLDPFMRQSIRARASETHPLVDEQITPARGVLPFGNHINGHESDNDFVSEDIYPDGAPANDRLQASCFYPLATPLAACAPQQLGCQCADAAERKAALCQPPDGDAPDGRQYFAEATPPVRLLQLAQAVGNQGGLGSICPKVLDPTHPHFGYLPSVEFLRRVLSSNGSSDATCWDYDLIENELGQVDCVVLQAFISGGEFGVDIDCEALGLSTPDESLLMLFRERMQSIGRCDEVAGCESIFACEVPQLQGEEQQACQTDFKDAEDFSAPGFCHLASACWDRDKSGIRVVGPTSGDNILTWMACQQTELDSSFAD